MKASVIAIPEDRVLRSQTRPKVGLTLSGSQPLVASPPLMITKASQTEEYLIEKVGLADSCCSHCSLRHEVDPRNVVIVQSTTALPPSTPVPPLTSTTFQVPVIAPSAVPVPTPVPAPAPVAAPVPAPVPEPAPVPVPAPGQVPVPGSSPTLTSVDNITPVQQSTSGVIIQPQTLCEEDKEVISMMLDDMKQNPHWLSPDKDEDEPQIIMEKLIPRKDDHNVSKGSTESAESDQVMPEEPAPTEAEEPAPTEAAKRTYSESGRKFTKSRSYVQPDFFQECQPVEVKSLTSGNYYKQIFVLKPEDDKGIPPVCTYDGRRWISSGSTAKSDKWKSYCSCIDPQYTKSLKYCLGDLVCMQQDCMFEKTFGEKNISQFRDAKATDVPNLKYCNYCSLPMEEKSCRDVSLPHDITQSPRRIDITCKKCGTIAIHYAGEHSCIGIQKHPPLDEARLTQTFKDFPMLTKNAVINGMVLSALLKEWNQEELMSMLQSYEDSQAMTRSKRNAGAATLLTNQQSLDDLCKSDSDKYLCRKIDNDIFISSKLKLQFAKDLSMGQLGFEFEGISIDGCHSLVKGCVLLALTCYVPILNKVSPILEMITDSENKENVKKMLYILNKDLQEEFGCSFNPNAFITDFAGINSHTFSATT